MVRDIEEIQKRRKLLGLTQKKLASLSGVSQSLIAKIESKKGRISPSYENVIKIFSALEKEEEKKTPKVKAKDIHNTKIVGVQESDTIIKASQIMNQHGYSQLPVFDGNIIIGCITENGIMSYISKGKSLVSLPRIPVGDMMSPEFPQVEESSPIESITYLLRHSSAVLTKRKGVVVGIITKADFFKLIK